MQIEQSAPWGGRAERKDATGGALDGEVKTILEAQATAFEEFKKTNDAALAEIKKLGAADALTDEKLKRVNDTLDSLGDALKAQKRHAEEVEAKLNRRGIAAGGDGDGDAEAKAAAIMSERLGQTVSVDDYRDYKSAMAVYLRKGDKGREPELKGLSVGSDPDGGYMVTPDVTGRIAKKVWETSPIRQYATVNTIGTDSIEGPIDNDEADAGWTAEKGPRNETDAPQIGKWTIPVHEIWAQPKATQRLLDDASMDVEGWLAGKVSDKIARMENAAFVLGDGVLKPKGLFAYAFAAQTDKSGARPWGTFEYVPSGAAGAFASANPGDALIEVAYALKPAYRQRAAYITTRKTLGKIRQFKDGQGQYLWSPGLAAGQPSTLLNFPVVEAEDVPEIAANSYSLAFGDIAETYQIIDRAGISVLRDPYTSKGWIKFYTTRRTGGGVVNFESMKFLKFAAS